MADPTKQIHDVVFGILNHVVADLWKRDLNVVFLGEEVSVELLVDIDAGEGFEPQQIRAFQWFEARQAEVLKSGENALLEWYQAVCDDYRGMLGVTNPNDNRVPVITTAEELRPLVTLTGIAVPYETDAETIGLIGECTWEMEHGFGVRFENGKVTRVGFQDVV